MTPLVLAFQQALSGVGKVVDSLWQILRALDGRLKKEGSSFEDGRGHMYYINFGFDCDSAGVIYLLNCKRCSKIYVGSTVTSFRKRFNNHKSSLKRLGKGQRGIAGEHLYAHFLEEGHKGIEDIQVKIIDLTDVNDPTYREGFSTYKLDSFVPKGLNLIDFSF